jgi:soluble lytic murein transglycosylase
MLSSVPKDWRLLAEARIRLAAYAKGAEASAAKLPSDVAGEPGLAYERVRFLRHEGKDEQATDLLEQQTAAGRPDLWWTERTALARRMLTLGQAERAYRLITANQLQTPAALTDAEFIAGWISLRFLKQPGEALPHFERLYSLAKLPLTLARGAYWAGRAAEASGHPATATEWYEKAAAYPTAYYGQLASAMPTVVPPPRPNPEPVATPAEKAAFDRQILVRAVRLLLATGHDDHIRPFLTRLADNATSAADFAATADFAEAIGRPDLGVLVAKKASYAGYSLLRAGYPVVWMPRNAGAEQALLLALTRQESAFELHAISPSGARGLMQLMPGTAADTARSIGEAYSLPQLTSDGVYNVTLGQAYLDGLLATFNGSYVLSIAAYNAGPGKVQQWLDSFGDPRQPGIDPVDWIEEIPYEETRNYVQRVLENLQIYRLRIGNRSLAFSLDSDLRR